MTVIDDEGISEFGQALRWACEQSIARGIPIRPWPEEIDTLEGCNCPLGALCDMPYPTTKVAAERLGIAELDTGDFVVGFDGFGARTRRQIESPWFALGESFRVEYAP